MTKHIDWQPVGAVMTGKLPSREAMEAIGRAYNVDCGTLATVKIDDDKWQAYITPRTTGSNL